MRRWQPAHAARIGGLGLLLAAAAAAAQQAPGLQVEVVTMTAGYLPKAASQRFEAAVQQAHGLTAGNAQAADARVGVGLLDRLATGDPDQPDLAASIDMDAASGHARMTAHGDLLGQVGATLTLYDTLLIVPGAAPLTYTVRVDLQRFAARGAGNDARFFVGLSAWDGRGYEWDLFGYGGRVIADDQGSQVSGLLFTPQGGRTLDQIPMQLTQAFELPALPDTRLHLRWQFSAGVGAAEGGEAAVGAGESVWLGIHGDYTSLGGYRYPGAAAPVPEPASATLLAAGALVLAGAAARARRRRG